MNQVSFRFFVVALAAVVLAGSASAHPGHGLGEHGALHLVSSPFHLLTLASLGMALWLASRVVQRVAFRRWLGVSGTLLVASAGIIWGLSA